MKGMVAPGPRAAQGPGGRPGHARRRDARPPDERAAREPRPPFAADLKLQRRSSGTVRGRTTAWFPRLCAEGDADVDALIAAYRARRDALNR